jgi:DNA-binding HxlR family transcriptional regulator
MLTQSLRALERDGLVARSVTPTVPVRVDYALTELGASMLPVLRAVKEWAELHMPDVDAAREDYDAAQDCAGRGGVDQVGVARRRATQAAGRWARVG